MNKDNTSNKKLPASNGVILLVELCWTKNSRNIRIIEPTYSCVSQRVGYAMLYQLQILL